MTSLKAAIMPIVRALAPRSVPLDMSTPRRITNGWSLVELSAEGVCGGMCDGKWEKNHFASLGDVSTVGRPGRLGAAA